MEFGWNSNWLFTNDRGCIIAQKSRVTRSPFLPYCVNVLTFTAPAQLRPGNLLQQQACRLNKTTLCCFSTKRGVLHCIDNVKQHLKLLKMCWMENSLEYEDGWMTTIWSCWSLKSNVFDGSWQKIYLATDSRCDRAWKLTRCASFI